MKQNILVVMMIVNCTLAYSAEFCSKNITKYNKVQRIVKSIYLNENNLLLMSQFPSYKKKLIKYADKFISELIQGLDKKKSGIEGFTIYDYNKELNNIFNNSGFIAKMTELFSAYDDKKLLRIEIEIVRAKTPKTLKD